MYFSKQPDICSLRPGFTAKCPVCGSALHNVDVQQTAQHSHLAIEISYILLHNVMSNYIGVQSAIQLDQQNKKEHLSHMLLDCVMSLRRVQ